MKPYKEKLADKITKGDFPLQFDCFDRFSHKVNAIENAKHREKMQWEDDREGAKKPKWRLITPLYKRQIRTENKSHKCNNAGDIN